MQSESVTLSVDYLISSAQAGFSACLGFLFVLLQTILISDGSLNDFYATYPLTVSSTWSARIDIA
jgi:hypothetical protein